jgi:hypothetical protein
MPNYPCLSFTLEYIQLSIKVAWEIHLGISIKYFVSLGHLYFIN